MSGYTVITKKRPPTRITGLWRVLFEDPRDAFWCGGIRFATQGTDQQVLKTAIGEKKLIGGVETTVRPPRIDPDVLDPIDVPTGMDSMPDGLFYIYEQGGAADNEITLDGSPIITKGDADFYDLPYRYTAVDVDNEGRIVEAKQKNFYHIVVNGHDNVVKIGRSTRSDGKVRPYFGHFIPSNAGIPTIGKDPTLLVGTSVRNGDGPYATFAIRGVRRITLYNGAVVYGGFKSWNPKDMHENPNTAKVQNFDHWIVFSDGIGSEFSCYSVDTSSALQIGDSPAEPVTQVIVNSTETDMMGIKGQLLVFTPQKVTYFDGLPPIPDDDRDSNFVSPAPPSPVGTWASRTVVRTEHGVVFLGADGVVYLVPARGTAVPIGRALESRFSQLTPLQQKYACATYVRGHYLLSVPNPDHDIVWNMEGWVADMRSVRGGARDLGVVWTGPMSWPPVGVFAVGRGPGDVLQVMGGSTVSSQIFDMWREDVNTDAPVRSTNTEELSPVNPKQKQILPHAQSNLMDLGDIGIDKSLSEVQLRMKTDNKVDLEVTVGAVSADLDNGELSAASVSFIEPVQPRRGKLGTDKFTLSPDQDAEIRTFRPPERLRGRAFVIDIREKPAIDADKDPKVAFSDLRFAVQDLKNRR